MLDKTEEQQITVLPDGQLQVRTTIIIKDDGKEIARTYHRHVVDVGETTVNESKMVKDIADKIHTVDRIQARETARNKEGK